jgi:hypothetical protein
VLKDTTMTEASGELPTSSFSGSIGYFINSFMGS